MFVELLKDFLGQKAVESIDLDAAVRRAIEAGWHRACGRV